MECKNNTGLLSDMKVEIKQEDQCLEETETEVAQKRRITLELVPVWRIKKEPVSEVNDADEDLSSQSPRLTTEQVSQDVSGTCTSLTVSDSGEHCQVEEVGSDFKTVGVFTDTRSYKCDLCEKSYKLSYNLYRHMRTSHLTGRRYKCDLCEESFKTKSSLYLHIRLSHLNARPYKCELCEKSFKVRSTLRLHRLSHSNATPYKCDLCEKSYKQKHRLKQHMQSHLNVRSYICDKCEKSFTSKSNLKQHMSAHSDTTPYKCETCQKCFKWQSSLYQHIWLHTNA